MQELPPFIVLPHVESTNGYAMELIRKEGAIPGTAVFTTHQTKGKGQWGRQWESEPDKNIAISFLLQPADVFPLDRFYFNAFLTLTCLRFLRRFSDKHFSIKWPNDLYWNDRKVAGILIENVVRGGRWQWSVAGIGINVNQQQFPGLEKKAASLSQVISSELDILQLAMEFRSYVLNSMNCPEEPASIMKQFNDNLYLSGKKVFLQSKSECSFHEIQEVDEQGRLLTLDQHGKANSFRVGEVMWK